MPLTFALQALLLRHEAYVADSERERHQMMDTIERLESEKLALEAKNAQTIKANTCSHRWTPAASVVRTRTR